MLLWISINQWVCTGYLSRDMCTHKLGGHEVDIYWCIKPFYWMPRVFMMPTLSSLVALQFAVPPVMSKLALWQLSVFSDCTGWQVHYTDVLVHCTGGEELSWCQLFHHWWLCGLWWQPAVPPGMMKLALWQLSLYVFIAQNDKFTVLLYL